MSSNPRTYCLLIKKAKSGRIRVGRLGVFEFPSGYYVYIGSAKKGMQARISRHLSRKKKPRWHIDYLLEEGVVEKVFLSEKKECEVNQEVFSLPGATLIAKKFGSSDCSCSSHLAYFSYKPSHLTTKIKTLNQLDDTYSWNCEA
jgi:Uri superfamily endonuclease